MDQDLCSRDLRSCGVCRRTWPKTGTIVDREKIPDRRAARSRDAMVLDGRIADIEIVCRGG